MAFPGNSHPCSVSPGPPAPLHTAPITQSLGWPRNLSPAALHKPDNLEFHPSMILKTKPFKVHPCRHPTGTHRSLKANTSILSVTHTFLLIEPDATTPTHQVERELPQSLLFTPSSQPASASRDLHFIRSLPFVGEALETASEDCQNSTLASLQPSNT